jgi:lipopolysaccharide biosynthesis glycosyltransferase
MARQSTRMLANPKQLGALTGGSLQSTAPVFSHARTWCRRAYRHQGQEDHLGFLMLSCTRLTWSSPFSNNRQHHHMHSLPYDCGACDSKMDADRVTIRLVLSCDEAFAMPLAVALRSIVDANQSGRPLDFYILAQGLSENSRKRISTSLPAGSASINWVPVDLTPFHQFSTASHISRMTYSRLLIPRILPDSIPRILYLDADLLVLEDIESLWHTNLEGAVVGAVSDGLDEQIKSGKPNVEDVPRVRDYFNAGVLLIDLKRWREQRISERALEYLAQHPRSPFSDQDALNVVCDGNWKQLDPRWNFQAHYETELSEMSPSQRPFLVHFVTSLKPWSASSHSLNAGFYDSFRNRTCFARTTLDKLRDRLEGGWSRSKRVLRRYAVLRAIWSMVMRPISN